MHIGQMRTQWIVITVVVLFFLLNVYLLNFRTYSSNIIDKNNDNVENNIQKLEDEIEELKSVIKSIGKDSASKLDVIIEKLNSNQSSKSSATSTNNNSTEKISKSTTSIKHLPTIIPVVLITANRAQYLERSMNALIKARSEFYKRNKIDPHSQESSSFLFPFFISQDGENSDVRTLIQNKYADDTMHIHHTPLGSNGYDKLANHYKWLLNRIFDVFNYEYIIMVEEDLQVSIDFFEYFAATIPILASEPEKTWCISAWNDNGQAKVVSDPKEIRRSSFLPGLGWLTSKSIWFEIRDKWAIYWDDLIRGNEIRKGRDCYAPEIARTYHFGQEGGASMNQFGPQLNAIKLNDKYIPFLQMADELRSKLTKENYDKHLKQELSRAKVINAISQIDEKSTTPYVIRFSRRGESSDFASFANQLGIMYDERAGLCRMEYEGVIPVRVGKGNMLYFVHTSVRIN